MGLFPFRSNLGFLPSWIFLDEVGTKGSSWVTTCWSCSMESNHGTPSLLQKLESSNFNLQCALALLCLGNLYPHFLLGLRMCVTHCRRTRSQSCPFCRDCLKGVDSADLWVFMDSRDVIDMATLTRENLRRLFMYIDKLPLVVPVTVYDPYDSHLR